jgi:PKD repeat protein/pimeloyl-ACP methyl ester carboxylesterase
MRAIALLISTCFSLFTYAQADLVLSSASFEPLAINRGDVLTTFATVTNAGNTTAEANYLFVYYSTDQTIAAEEIISRVAIPALAPGESHDVTFYYPTAATLPTGDHFIALEIDPFNDVPESNEENLFCAGTGPNCATFTVLPGGSLGGQRFVYPVLFIHGLNGNSKTWNEFGSELQRELGWVYGGRLDYCLNPDNDQTTSDGNILSFVDPGQLGLGDFYTLNFDINASGDLFVSDDGIPFNNFESNQSAIVKQGWAVRDAVDQIMQFADVDRVIIVGHSMGGLAGRQYLTNPELWQDDGDHHIAKLMTVGTPHGGSNLNSGGLGSIFTGIDERSEATRDLRYQSLFFNGQFLNGGFESAVSSFYNNDVNVNGVVGDLIVGLNEKLAIAGVDYSCIVGVGDNLPSLSGDGVVDADRADLNNYLPAPPPLLGLHADRFLVTTAHTDIHKENTDIMLRALDEPDFEDNAYQLPLEQLHFSFVSEQPTNSPQNPGDNPDYDDFRITLPTAGRIEVLVRNIPVHDFAVAILPVTNDDAIASALSEGRSEITLSTDVAAGDYILEFGGLPTANSWRFPFAHFVGFTPAEPLIASFTTDIAEGCSPLTVAFTNGLNDNELTYNWSFPGGSPATSTSPNPSVVYNASGSYSATLIVSDGLQADTLNQEQLITIVEPPLPGFDFTTENNLSVDFTNTTTFSGTIPTYLWDFGDGATSTEAAPSHEFPSAAVYTVTLTVTSVCGIETTTQQVDLSTVATTTAATEDYLRISPNPASSSVTVETTHVDFGPATIQLVSVTGKTVYEKHLPQSARNISFVIDLDRVPAGTYIVKLSANNVLATRRLIVQ